MARIFRWLIRLTSGLIVLGVAGLALAVWLMARSLPDYDLTLELNGISAPLEIVRDTASVPHIFGENDADVYFGLGFAHAQDRLWQMIMMRRTVQGRMAEVFGPRMFESDALMRRLDLYALSQDSVHALAPETRAALDAYADGVNAWLNEVNAGARGRGAPEFFVFSNQVAPWMPADSVALLKLMALQMTSHLEFEVLRARLSLVLPQNRLIDILPDVPGPAHTALPSYAALFPDAPGGTELAAISPAPDPLSPFRPAPFGGASNAWAAAPNRSASGATLLANDPHLAFSAPGLWYLARLELESGGVIGATIPGIPAILSGRSAAFGWGITTAFVDDQDLFIERLNPDNPTEALTPQGYRPMATRQSIVQVKDAPPVTLDLQWSANGPILPADQFDLAAITPPGHAVALGWTGLSASDTSMNALIALMQAKNIEDGIAAGRDMIAPALNLTMAEGDGIALKLMGAIPERSTGHQSQGRIPAPGWIANNRWQGIVDYEENPEFIRPEGGILGNFNNKLIDQPFPDHVSFTWGDHQRVGRWQRLMQSREVHTRESFIEAQNDTVAPDARALLPLVAADLWFTGAAAAEGTPERQRQRALTLLAEWNGEMSEHLPEPLIYSAWMRALQDRLIRDELGPLARRITHVEPLFIERAFRNIDGAGIWCDVIQSAPVETCTDIARMALDDALVWIAENHPGALESLRWGDAHQATHDHPVMGRVPVLRWFVNIRQSTSGGDNTLMRGLTKGTDPQPFLNVHGAGYRGVYDFADPDSSVFVTSTGQSGHFLSRHYDDLGGFWRRGEYVPMSLDPNLARAAPVGITVLRPTP